VDLNLWNELHALVDEIHTGSTPKCFKDPANFACSFHMQRKELIEPWNPVSTQVPCQQEEHNAAINILKALNLTGGLFDQPAACTFGLSVSPHANSLLSAFCIWGQLADANPHPDAPPCPPPTNNNHASTHTLTYINKLEAHSSRSAPPDRVPASEFQCDHPSHFDLCYFHSNAPPPCNNPPSLCQPIGPSAPLPPHPQGPMRPLALLGLLPGCSFDCWAQRPPPQNNGRPPPSGRPPNGRLCSG
ncbi:hypothetical protein C0993_008187, partial [Termitomyces sp. T159_Od127]